MKFLGQEAEGRQLMPLNFLYDAPYGSDDTLMIVYKDIVSGEKFVKNIKKPNIVVSIVKPQYRGKEMTASEQLNVSDRYNKDFLSDDQVDKVLVRYKNRKYEVAKLLNIEPTEVDGCPYVAGTDVDVRHWYFIEFLHEYNNDLPKPLKVAYGDIEAYTRGFAKNQLSLNSGKFPFTCITMIIDGDSPQVYTLIINDQRFGRMNEIIDRLNDLKTEVYDRFTPTYGPAEYHMAIFDNEIDMIAAFWNLVKTTEPDFLLFWNAPFDVSNLIDRITVLGYNPNTIICDERFDRQIVDFEEDKRTFVLHKKKHRIRFSLATLIDCQMKMYAGVRSAKHKIPNFSLDAIAKMEKIGTKDSYVDHGDINKFLEEDFWNYIIYNINDVWLQVGIGRKTKDTDDIYSRMISVGVTEPEVFTSTQLWANYIKYDLEEHMHMVLANNKNKNIVVTKEIIECGFDLDDTDEDGDSDDDDFDEILDNINEAQTVLDKDGKKKKFSGAIVLNPNRMRPTGVMINSNPAKYVHHNIIDQDITAEYPSSIAITNLSNDTFVGKIYLDNPYDIELPFYSQYDFKDGEAGKYRMNKAAIIMETISQGDYLIAGEAAFNLPSITELYALIMSD